MKVNNFPQAIPSQISQNEALLRALKPFPLSKSEWAKYLGVTRRTLFRWEVQIIKYVFLILKEYKIPNQKYLDNYQRFILLIISCKKFQKVKDKELKTWLKTNSTNLRREDFMAWQERISSIEGANKLFNKYKIQVFSEDSLEIYYATKENETELIQLRAKSLSDLMHLILNKWFVLK